MMRDQNVGRGSGWARRTGWLLGVVGSAALLSGVGDVQAREACIGSGVQATLNECPGGKFEASAGRKPGASYKGAAPTVGLQKKDAGKPSAPVETMSAASRDERVSSRQAKSRQLLIRELRGLEDLVKGARKTDPEKPKLLRRLADGYAELEGLAFRDKTEAGIEADEKKKSDPAGAKAAKKKADEAEAALKLGRKKAIDNYKALKDQYPEWCQSSNKADPTKSTGCADEVLYYLAYEYEQDQNKKEATAVYQELTDKFPKSRFVASAYLAFGELFFADAQTDPSQWEIAGQFYSKVLEYPAPENKVWGYAQYKLGYVLWNTGENAKALDAFRKTIEFGAKFPQIPSAKTVAESARKDIIPVYALGGDPKKAYEQLKPLSGDEGGSNQRTLKMLEELGQAYLDTGHYREAVDLYADLMKRNAGPKSCEYQSRITEATQSLKASDKDAIRLALDKQVATYESYDEDKGNSAELRLKCANMTADLVAETAMAWHIEAVGNGGVKGTGDKKTMKLAAELYQVVLDHFKPEEFERFEFPKILKDDWPTVAKIKYSMADLLYFQQDWAKCGPAFDAVVASDPTGPQAAEAAFASVLCYQKVYESAHAGGTDKKGSGNLPKGAQGSEATATKGKEKDKKPADKAKFARKEFTETQKGMMTAFNRYVCYVKPADSDKEAKEQYVEVKFARARTYFEAQQWEEAALAFRDIALNYPEQDAGIYASQLYLEALNILGNSIETPRSSCYDDMGKDVPQFLKLYCEDEKKAKDNAEQCGILTGIQRDIERLRAEAIIKEADKGGPEAIHDYERGGEAYMALWKKYGEGPCERKEASCERAEEILYNAARAFQAARLVARSIKVRNTLNDPKYNLQNTELAKKSLYEIGGNYQAIAVYDAAATYYEKFAKANPKMEKAPSALQDAVVLRLGLGQDAEALRDAEEFGRNYGAKSPAQAAQIAFAIAAHYVEREEWDQARKQLSVAMSQIDKSATVDVQIQAHAMLAKIHEQTKNAKAAGMEYAKVRDSWKDPEAMIKKLDALGGDDGAKVRRLGKVLTAVGQALFFFAEQRRLEVDKIKFPEYKGNGQREDVQKHIATKVKDWMAKKRPAIEETEKEYLKILELSPPPPMWVIAAGSHVGQMWGKYVAEFRAAPIPKEWNQKGNSPFGDENGPLAWEEIRGAYYASLDAASEGDKQRAKGAYKKCLDYSIKYQYFDEYSRACEKWLSKNYGAEYHMMDEFRGAPTRVNAGMSEPPVPLQLDGTPYVARPSAAKEKGEAMEPDAGEGSDAAAGEE